MADHVTLADLRRFAVARSLFKPTTLPAAINRLGFVQADPLRAPARAQDLILRHRVKGYLAGDLERRYARLAVEEDCLVNYGFVPRQMLPLLHPRSNFRREWDPETAARAEELMAFIRQRRETRSKDVLSAFAHHGRTTGYWGEHANVSTHLLDGLHYRGQLRVLRREAGTRVYAAVEHPPVDQSPAAQRLRAEALLDVIVKLYAPLPAASLGYLASLLGYGAPHLKPLRAGVLKTATERYAHAEVAGQRWFWPPDEKPLSKRHAPDGAVRLLAPFDPIVWDRRRFELLWGWAYRFEAYTPAAKRQMGHYALPLLWGEDVIGWANVRVEAGRLRAEPGFVRGRPPGPAFSHALEEELARMSAFLSL